MDGYSVCSYENFSDCVHAEGKEGQVRHLERLIREALCMSIAFRCLYNLGDMR